MGFITEDDDCWEKYGFPDVNLMPSGLPMLGLCKAVEERYAAIGLTASYLFDRDFLYNSFYTNPSYGLNWFEDTYVDILSSVSRYIIPDSINYDDLTYETWTIEKIEKKIGEKIFLPHENNKMLFRFDAKVMLQYYKVLNLLTACIPQYCIDYYSGSYNINHIITDIAHERQMSIDNAKVNSECLDWFNTNLINGISNVNIYENFGLYSNFYDVINIRFKPIVKTYFKVLNQNNVLGLNFGNASGDLDSLKFDNFGHPISFGKNIIRSTGEYFIQWGEKPNASGMTDSRDYGYRVDGFKYLFFSDFSPVFKFK